MRWSKDQDIRILMLGLDSAGKVRSQHHSGTIPELTTITDDYPIPTTSECRLPRAVYGIDAQLDWGSSLDDT